MSRDWTNLLWRERTACENTQAIIAFIIAGIVGLAMAAAVIWALGETVEGITHYQIEHTRCLKNATNGYEIRKCR